MKLFTQNMKSAVLGGPGSLYAALQTRREFAALEADEFASLASGEEAPSLAASFRRAVNDRIEASELARVESQISFDAE